LNSDGRRGNGPRGVRFAEEGRKRRGNAMTAIKGFIAPSRRPGELGIHSVDHFHFVVPDLAVARNFYGEFGLDVGERGNTVTLKTFEHSHRWGTIGEGPRKKYGYVSFGAFEEDIERFAERLQAMRIERLDPPPGVDSNGLWFRDHDGVLVEIKVRKIVA
jgi:hypothetical protein